MYSMKHFRSILVLPGIVLFLIPALIAWIGPPVNIGWRLELPLSLLPTIAGGLLIFVGIALVVHTIRLFAKAGKGTLAPWDSTEKLVKSGSYRLMRNPMITGVFFILLGEAVFLGSLPIFVWFLIFLVINAFYIPFSEELGLETRFGDEYRSYKEDVPRWIPRRTPWESTSYPDSDRFE
jgi:protein-S-isoprenylcysteine O-methyltransferase Ste14